MKQFIEKYSNVEGLTIEELTKDVNILIKIVLNNLAVKLLEETFVEDRKESNLLDHIVNEIRKYKYE